VTQSSLRHREIDMAKDSDSHQFVVTDVQLADEAEPGGVALLLTDVRGGRVRLRLDADMAELLRRRIAAAIDRTEGP
jgi:hypothetical protein